jgi:hypothetical protein
VPTAVSIPTDINPPVDPSIDLPRDKDGKIRGTVDRIYPVYTMANPTAQHDGFMGNVFEPFYFALVDLSGGSIPSEQLTIPDYYILVQLPAITSTILTLLP